MKLNYLQKAENFESQAGAYHIAMVRSQGHCLTPASVEHLSPCPQHLTCTHSGRSRVLPSLPEMQKQKQREAKAAAKVHMATSALTQVLGLKSLCPGANVEI